MNTKQRNALVANAKWLHSRAGHIGYSQHRPFPLKTKAQLAKLFSAGGSIAPDCSGFVVLTYHLTSGVKDPTGRGFDGNGNSQDMQDRLPHYANPIDAHPGALVVFGADLALGHQHVCMVIEHGKNPMLVSHGQPGVKLLTLSQEQTAHGGSTVFLDVGSL